MKRNLMRLCFTIAAFLLMTLLGAVAFAEVVFEIDSFPDEQTVKSSGWTTWCQREEISPRFFVAETPNLGGDGSLAISGNSDHAAYGCWMKTVKVEAGSYYSFGAAHCEDTVTNPRVSIVARLDWRKADGGRAGRPDYVPDGEIEGKWHHVTGVFKAPEDASSVEIELYLGWNPQGTVWWDSIRLEKVPPVAKRTVRVATANCFPRDNTSSAESVEEFAAVADEAGRAGCDIICLGEWINLAGVRGKAYADIAETIPGASTERLGEVAKEHGMYIVAALGEREGHAIYNTSVLIGRDGKVKGKYRKVQLPREEIEAGVTPGASYPVFDTDFGRIGMMVCWDNQYAEPARALAIQGAEIILMPIWGGNEILTKARAIENQVFVVSSSYSDRSAVYGPWGEVLAEAKERPGIAYVDIDLNEVHPEPWLGNMKHRFYREMRADIPVPGY